VDRRKELKKPEFVFKLRHNGTPTPLPLPLPPPRLDSSLGAGTVNHRGVTASSPTTDTSSHGKVSALRTYRRVRGEMGSRPQVCAAGSATSSSGIVGHVICGFRP
jgi:hypothetical protein